ESQLSLTLNRTPQGPRWAGPQPGDRLLFGDLQSSFLSAIFRQQLVLRARLVCQAYAQLFTASGRYQTSFAALPVDAQPIHLRDLVVTGMPLEGFARAGLRLNLVLRWEYRLGSTLFLVFNHAGENPPGRQPSSAFGPVGLGQGRAFDTFLV